MADYEEAERAMWAGLRVLESHLATVRTNLNRLVRTTASEMGELKEELRTAWEEVNLERSARHNREPEPATATEPDPPGSFWAPGSEPEPVPHEIEVTQDVAIGNLIKVQLVCHGDGCDYAVTIIQTNGKIQDTIDAIVHMHEDEVSRRG